MRLALAEAHFRRALIVKDPSQQQAELARAVELSPGEGRYWYHLGLARHRADQLAEAIAAYTHATEAGFSRSASGFARGLAEIERDPHIDLEGLHGLSPADRAALLPIAALLRGDPQAMLDSRPGNWLDHLKEQLAADPASALWRGLALLATGQTTQALETLTPAGHSLKGGAEAARALYHGLAAAAMGNLDAALAEWTAAAARTPTPRLQAAVASAHLRQARAAFEAEQWTAVLTAAQAVRKAAPDQSSLVMVCLVADNRLAGEAATRGDWSAAIRHWQDMRASLDNHPELGPITPILHNLAIAYERLEQWEAAAGGWSALLSKLPRRPTKKLHTSLHLPLPVSELRAWLRRRVLECYKRAGRPDQAITHYRSAIKANPDDLDLRLELAGALIANEQIVAGRNELQRILSKDPRHLEARVRLAELHLQRDEFYAAEQQLRAALEIDPQHTPARRGLVEILSERGHEHFNVAYYAQAKKIYEEALQYVPDDAQLLVWLGNTELAMAHVTAARQRFDAALATGDLHTFISVFGCWAERGNMAEARQILKRAEAAGVASPHFYVDIAGECFKNARRLFPPGAFLGPSAAKAAADNPWERLGHESLQKAESADGASVETLRHVIAVLGTAQPDLALEYAHRLARLTPDDPVALMQLAVLQGLIGQTKAAKDALHKAAWLARKQGNSSVLREIEEIRPMINSPFMGMLSHIGFPHNMLDDFDDEDLF